MGRADPSGEDETDLTQQRAHIGEKWKNGGTIGWGQTVKGLSRGLRFGLEGHSL